MPSDEQLMRAYKDGNTAALRELFQRYSGILLRMLARDLHPPETARDLVQQTFLQLHRARFDFDETQQFKPWLFTIALNLKREYFRGVRRRPELLGAEALLERAAPDQPHERAEAVSSLRWALARIPGEQREVIELHWFEGLSFVEVANCLGIGAPAAKVRAHRGYAKLRALLRAAATAGDESNPEDGTGI